MPAVRSRTENWRRSLEQLRERNGAIEIALPRYLDGAQTPEERKDDGSNIVWRVRVLGLTDNEIIVEQPQSLGRPFNLEVGLDLAGIIAIGQNRWMFRTKVNAQASAELKPGVRVPALQLQMPEKVERCQRRNFFRVKTVGLELPAVVAYPLQDPATAAGAERANQRQIEEMQDRSVAGAVNMPHNADAEDVKPEVGPPVESVMMNLGGGGIGLLLEEDDRVAFERHRTYWLNITLTPHIPVPLCVVGRVRHTHIDSSQRLYAGLSFEFGHNPAHEQFVVDQLCKYVAIVQRRQLENARKSA